MVALLLQLHVMINNPGYTGPIRKKVDVTKTDEDSPCEKEGESAKSLTKILIREPRRKQQPY